MGCSALFLPLPLYSIEHPMQEERRQYLKTATADYEAFRPFAEEPRSPKIQKAERPTTAGLCFLRGPPIVNQVQMDKMEGATGPLVWGLSSWLEVRRVLLSFESWERQLLQHD